MSSQNYPNFGCGWEGPVDLASGSTLSVRVNDTGNAASTNSFYISGAISGSFSSKSRSKSALATFISAVDGMVLMCSGTAGWELPVATRSFDVFSAILPNPKCHCVIK